ncbi:MAG TPA: trypsin-like peptidase domain-containing protein [Thermoanaerobaculia bacterium]|nr:trypsin-like peptidase domain-containing protein [Thermoanaerobaculia bacterium]
MPSRPRFSGSLFLILLAAAGCRRDVTHLDDVQKMAYSVKPAVVRVNAYATAEFRYPAAAIEGVRTLITEGRAEPEPAEDSGVETVETGAGGSGSGFVVHPDGVIITSGHVVAPTRDPEALRADLLRNGAIAALVKNFPLDDLRTLYRGEGLDRYIGAIASRGSLANIVTVNTVELSNGEKHPFQIERYSPSLPQRGADLALLRIRRRGLPSLRIGDSDALRVGDSIWSVGYPAVASSTDEVIGGWLSRESDLEPTVNPGTVTALKTDSANRPVIQSNVAIYRGNSGGPAVTREGEVIGISTWGHTNAEQIKFLVPINLAKQLLASSRIPVDVDSKFDQMYQAALNDAQGGRWMDARRRLDEASALFPKSPDLIRLRNDTERALRSMPAWRRRPFASAAVGAVLVLVLAVGAGLTLSRRVPVTALAAGSGFETVMPLGDAPAEQQMLGRFTILNGSRAGQKLALGGSGIRIGRESAICEIVLENPKVSRLHAEVVSMDGKVLLIDRNSSNGTYVNDQKIDRRFLRDGDIIYFGGRNAVAVAFHA